MSPSRSAPSRGKRFPGWLTRGLLVVVVILSTSAVLLHAALGARRMFSAAKLATESGLAVHSARSHGEPAAKHDAAERTLADETADIEGADGESTDESPSEDLLGDADDSDDIDEMVVQRLPQIAGAAFFAWLWHETPRLSGVIHSPEPRPARLV
jgi:hypothetical protein